MELQGLPVDAQQLSGGQQQRIAIARLFARTHIFLGR
jgi:ABC-type polar amino acid transport system ATPase subunit